MEWQKEHDTYIKIINAVREWPCLYDRTHEFYTNKRVRQTAFVLISNNLDIQIDLLMKRWNLLRQRFYKEKRAAQIKQKASAWPYYNDLTFVEKFIVTRAKRKNNTQLSPVDFKEENSINLTDCEDDDESEIPVNNILSDMNGDELDVLKHASPTSELSTSSSHVDSPLPAKRSKISINALCERVSKLEKSLNNQSATLDTDEAFVKSIVSLLQGLPVTVKEEFQADMYHKVYRLRAELREKEFN